MLWSCCTSCDLCWAWMNPSLLYHCRYNVFICEILLLHTIGVLYWIIYSLGNIWVKHCIHNIKELIMNDKFSFVITPVMPQSHPTVGPIRFLSPVRFLSRKAEWSARRNFTPVLFSWSHQATGPLRLDTAVQIWFRGIIRRTPRVPCVMPLQKEIHWLPEYWGLTCWCLSCELEFALLLCVPLLHFIWFNYPNVTSIFCYDYSVAIPLAILSCSCNNSWQTFWQYLAWMMALAKTSPDKLWMKFVLGLDLKFPSSNLNLSIS